MSTRRDRFLQSLSEPGFEDYQPEPQSYAYVSHMINKQTQSLLELIDQEHAAFLEIKKQARGVLVFVKKRKSQALRNSDVLSIIAQFVYQPVNLKHLLVALNMTGRPGLAAMREKVKMMGSPPYMNCWLMARCPVLPIKPSMVEDIFEDLCSTTHLLSSETQAILLGSMHDSHRISVHMIQEVLVCGLIHGNKNWYVEYRENRKKVEHLTHDCDCFELRDDPICVKFPHPACYSEDGVKQCRCWRDIFSSLTRAIRRERP